MFVVLLVGCKNETDNAIIPNPSVEASKTDEKEQADEKSDEDIFEQVGENKAESIKTEPAQASEGHTHSYKIDIIKTTCTKDGYTLNTCECGDK